MEKSTSAPSTRREVPDWHTYLSVLKYSIFSYIFKYKASSKSEYLLKGAKQPHLPLVLIGVKGALLPCRGHSASWRIGPLDCKLLGSRKPVIYL